MAISIPQHHIEAFIKDPVLAAYVYFGVELDHFQAARLRALWFVPMTIDSSGISLAKTEILFLWANLRMILLPQPRGHQPRRIGIFYQTLGGAQAVWHQQRFEKYVAADAAKLFRAELKPMHGGRLGYKPLKDALQYHFRNGGFVECPAVNLGQDSKNLAGRRYHDSGTDEAPEFDVASNALEKQLLGRTNAPCFNKNNPMWANHVKLLGHAHDPESHPFYKRVKTERRAIHDGSQDTILITSSFRDFSPEFAAKYRNDEEIRRDKMNMSRASFMWIREGLWEHGSEDWYDGVSLKSLKSKLVRPEIRREQAKGIYTLGWDTAQKGNKRNDWNAGVALRALRVPNSMIGKKGVWMTASGLYHIAPVWATAFKDKDPGECAGLIHRAHQRFSFARMVLDPGGGGLAVGGELWKTDQFFDNRSNVVTGICNPENHYRYPEALPLMRYFGRGEEDIQHVWGEDKRYRTSDEGPVHAIHTILRNMVDSRSIAWPEAMDDRDPREVAKWEAERRVVSAFLEMCYSQLGTIRVAIQSDGTPKMTKRGFLTFEAKQSRKKDIAYALIYALTAMLSILEDPDEGADSEDGVLCEG